jgi:ribosomal protein L7/L12
MADWQEFWNDHNDSSRIGFLGRKIEAIERQLDLIMKELKLDLPDAAPDSPDLAAVKALINQGNKLEAIQVYRQRIGGSLAEAKSAVEALERGEKL